MRYQEDEDAVGQCSACNALVIDDLNGECPSCGTIFNRCDLCEEVFVATGRNTCDECIRAEYAAGSTKVLDDY